jgi:hypothetical protein
VADQACVVTQLQAAHQPWLGAFQRVVGLADRNHVAQPIAVYYVPSIYVDPAGFWAAVKNITADADDAYELSVIYSLTGDTTFAAPAAAILRAWSSVNQNIGGANGQLSMAEVGVGFILSAELLNPYSGFTASDRTTFANWVRTVYYPLAAVSIRDRANNWGDWGIFGSVMAHHYLNEKVGLDSETVRLENHIDFQIANDGSLPAEIARGPASEIWYTYYALDPMAAAARVLNNAGEPDLLTWTSPNGHTIASALNYLLYLTQNAGRLGLTGPRVQDPWPAELFDAMGILSGNSAWTSYAATKSPNMYVGHHYAWTFPTLQGVPPSLCP